MSKAPLVITAVIVEGRGQGEAARADGVAQGWSAGWWRATGLRGGGVRAPITASEDLTHRDQRQHRRADHPAAETAVRARPRRRARHHRLAPGPAPPARRVASDDQPLPHCPRPGHPAAQETAPLVLGPLPGSPCQPNLAGRLHPLPARRRHRRRDPHLARRPLPLRPARVRLAPRHRTDRPRHLLRRGRRPRHPASTLTDNAMVFTTAWPAARAGATPSKPSCDACTWRSRTPAPTTPRPAARWSGSSRR
jgi:hypothetical protein